MFSTILYYFFIFFQICIVKIKKRGIIIVIKELKKV